MFFVKRFNTLLKPWLLLTLTALPLSAAQAATVQFNGTGVATGITNLAVGSSNYNVDFIFTLSHNDWVNNFDVTNQTEADAVLQAIAAEFDASGVTTVEHQGNSSTFNLASATLWYGSNGTSLLGRNIDKQSFSASDIWGNFIGGSTAPLNNNLPFAVDLTPVPVPAAVWLFGSGLLVLIGLKKKYKS
ncbi:MAG: hypothetical protein AB2531_06565 [Candidatus Thiodiazotropha sp.]